MPTFTGGINIALEIPKHKYEETTTYLTSKGITARDEFEQIPKDKHWITDPAGTVMILSAPERSGAFAGD